MLDFLRTDGNVIRDVAVSTGSASRSIVRIGYAGPPLVGLVALSPARATSARMGCGYMAVAIVAGWLAKYDLLRGGLDGVRVAFSGHARRRSATFHQARRLEYGMVRIGERDHPVPLRSVKQVREGRRLVRNETMFRTYRRFEADSRVVFQ